MRSWWKARKRELPEDLQEKYVRTDDRRAKKKKDEIMDTLSVISNKWGMPSSNFTMSFEYNKEEGWKSKIVKEKTSEVENEGREEDVDLINMDVDALVAMYKD